MHRNNCTTEDHLFHFHIFRRRSVMFKWYDVSHMYIHVHRCSTVLMYMLTRTAQTLGNVHTQRTYIHVSKDPEILKSYKSMQLTITTSNICQPYNKSTVYTHCPCTHAQAHTHTSNVRQPYNESSIYIHSIYTVSLHIHNRNIEWVW